MAYALRSKGDPSPQTEEEHTDTPVSNLTETLVTTTTEIPFVSPQLNEAQTIVLPILEANQTLSTADIISYLLQNRKLRLVLKWIQQDHLGLTLALVQQLFLLELLLLAFY